MDNPRLILSPLITSAYPEAADVCRHSRHFLVDISGEEPESIGLDTVTREVREAEEHGGVMVGITLKGNNQMVGLASYVPRGYHGQPSRAWIALLMISETFHHLGYGTEACRLIEEGIFADEGVLSIELGVLANNPAALAFWQEMGYRATGDRKEDHQGRLMLLMEKSRG